MVTQEVIAEVIDSQRSFWMQKGFGVTRAKAAEIKLTEGFATIITGIRRCGKSTLMKQLWPNLLGTSLFLNFEDPRLTGFEVDDFRRLDAEILERKVQNLLFDEVQMLDHWELYIRQKLDEGFQVIVTGSNASLLSKELGTKLTGRHLSTELFPFNYSEFLEIKGLEDSVDSVKSYLTEGGFPEFLKTGNPEILHQLLDDILLRDIAVRQGVRDTTSLRRLAVYLLSNIAKPVSATRLAKVLEIKAPSTVLEYFSYLENAYLVEFMPKFSYSAQVQTRNLKKVYSIDLGLSGYNSISFSEDTGRRLENMVYLHYRQQNKKLYYFNEDKECDFIVMDRHENIQVVQVCSLITQDNLKREMSGLKSALAYFKLTKGTIITFDQKDTYNTDGFQIDLVPIRELLLE